MDLESATNLKRELQSIFAIRVRGVTYGKLAFGVAAPTAAADYRVAVRAPSEEDFPDEARRLVEQMTAGEADVRVVGSVRAIGAPALSANRCVSVGASIAHYLCNSAGTLGFFARRESDGAIGFVSCNHVIAAEDRGQDGDEILHPAPMDHGDRSVIGHLVKGYPLLDRTDPVVDCAFARLVSGTPYDVSSPDPEYAIVATDVPPFAEREVFKFGRTTGLTTGHITAFDLDTEIVYSHNKTICLRQQIEIDSTAASSFAVGGDSGSLVVTRLGHPVGLVCAASAAGGYKNHGLAYANPIRPVLDALGVTLLV